MHWNLAPFQSLYDSIEAGGKIDTELFEYLLEDLQSLNLNNKYSKNATSRSKLEKGEITVGDGSTYKLSQDFIAATIKLSDELNLDELAAAELILSSFSDDDSLQNVNYNDVLLIKNGKVQYYLRRQYILQLVTYIVNCLKSDDVVYTRLTENVETLSKNILFAFEAIHRELAEIKQLINRAQILDTNDVLFQQNVKFRRDFLLKEYDALGQLLFITTKKKGNFQLSGEQYTLKLLDHVSGMNPNDYFLVYYLPTFFYLFQNLEDMPDEDVRSLHSTFLADLKDETLYTKPFRIFVIFVFLSFFISWCKRKPETRAKQIDFRTEIDIPMSMSVELGAIEQLLVFAADTSDMESSINAEIFYDIRSLLQRHLPRLVPGQLMDTGSAYSEPVRTDLTGTNAGNNNGTNSLVGSSLSTPMRAKLHNGQKSTFQYRRLELSGGMQSILLTTFNCVLQTIISDCAFLLTRIKDSEEDSLLSGEDLSLDDVAVKADLERFFLSIHYFYASRPYYAKQFWEDKESSAYGFIEWSTKCTDPLMRSCFYLMISSLACGIENGTNVFHYFGETSPVSWANIAQHISDYIGKISNLSAVIQQRQQIQESTEVTGTEVALEEGLNEEAIILLSALFMLINSVAQNVSGDVKVSLCNLFKDIMFEFAKLDTPLIGACFMVLSTLLPQQKSIKSSYWFSLDALIYKSRPLLGPNSTHSSVFELRLTNVSEVLGFLCLIDSLLKIDNSGDFDGQLATFGTLEFPPKLGQGYRKAGIWPYFDYILTKIFVPSASISNQTSREFIQRLVLQIIDTSLRSFDYNAVLNSIAAGADLNKLVVTNNIVDYVLENPATAVFNYLFDEKVFQTLFRIANAGVDLLPTELAGGENQTLLLELAIKIINNTLTYQETFIEEFLPMLMKHKMDTFFLPKYIGLKGLRSFFDAIFLNLKIVPNLALYVGAPRQSLALSSLQILEKLASLRSGEDSSFSLSTSNKFMTILDTVDESSRIKEAFVTQIDAPVNSNENLRLKLGILKFINENLSYSHKAATVAHLLLGFEVSSNNNVSVGPKLSTYVSSRYSLFNSIVSLLVASLAEIDSNNIQHLPMTLVAISMEIVLKLCRNSLTSRIVLEILAADDLFQKLVKYDPQVSKITLWENRLFEFRTSEELADFATSGSMGAVLLFLTYRNHLIDYLSLFLHHMSFNGTESQVLAYTNFLVSNATFSARIFSFLDVLNYGTIPSSGEMGEELSIFGDLRLPLDGVTLDTTCSGSVFNLKRIDELMHLYKRAHEHSPNLSRSLPDGKTYNEVADEEMTLVKSHICHLLGNKMFEDLRLSVIKSWVQLVQIVVTDGKLAPLIRSSFILEVFSTIVPRVNDYVEMDISFSEQLVSLIVFLYEIYEGDLLMMDKHKAVDARLLDIFRVSIHGIISPLSSIFLRSDCYVLANQYLTRLLKEKKFSRDVFKYLRINSDQLVEVVCNDSIYGQGTSRIASILLLDALVQIGNLNRENFILETLTKTSKLMLVIRLLKDMDSILTSGNSGIDVGDFLYELGTFKAVAYLLIRIAESRLGAQALIENKILQTIDSCSFLKMDPNLGVNLVFNELPGKKTRRSMVNFSLEIPMVLDGDEDTLSLFELIIPVFQLLCAILIGAGSQNRQVIWNIKKLLLSSRKLLVGIFKRDALESSEGDQKADRASWGLREMVKLASVLCVLTGYQGEQDLFNNENTQY